VAAAGHAGSRDGIAPGARENRVPTVANTTFGTSLDHSRLAH